MVLFSSVASGVPFRFTASDEPFVAFSMSFPLCQEW
jgi:hypothetical protein